MGNSMDAALYRSVRVGQVEDVRKALKQGANPNVSIEANIPVSILQ